MLTFSFDLLLNRKSEKKNNIRSSCET